VPVGARRPGPTSRGLADSAARAFAGRYGRQPEAVWFAPGRVNLIGEHTDYNGGFVLPFALSAGVAVAAARRRDRSLAVWSRQRGDTAALAMSELRPGNVTGWAAYPFGVAWALGAAGHHVGGTDIAIDCDLAIGAGLSSSAALECAVALALTELHGVSVPRTELAALASRAENEFAGAPTGIMDQSAALMCRAGHALLLDCRSGESSQVPLDPAAAGLALLVIDTRARHDLTDGSYAARRQSCEAAARLLGVRSLRDLDGNPELVAQLSDADLQRRARHVAAEDSRVLAAAELLRQRRLPEIGPLLAQSHASLRDDFEVSWPEADVAVEAVAAAGALGARMIGGGFGGSVLALLPVSAVRHSQREVTAAFAERGWSLPGYLAAVPSGFARRAS